MLNQGEKSTFRKQTTVPQTVIKEGDSNIDITLFRQAALPRAQAIERGDSIKTLEIGSN